ncbi:MAG: helix-turn-helix transcriptional regulator [Parvularculaceae bacterium]|nr:helix-turn-helix transcriptional regulator [Parvularculaceae bacterium]
MGALADYLVEARLDASDFARMLGIAPEALARILSNDTAPDYALARRISDVTDGAVTIDELIDGAGDIIDLRRRVSADEDEIDQQALEKILAELLPELVGGASRKGDEYLPRLAADAVVGAYTALSSVTTCRNADRLVQALLPVFVEILAETAPDLALSQKAEPLAHEAAERYLLQSPQRR